MKTKNLLLLLLLFFSVQMQASKVSYYFWQGKLDGQKVKLACAVKDCVLTGELFQTIGDLEVTASVAGMWSDGMYDIKVYLEGDGTDVDYCYFLRAKISDNQIEGIIQPSGKKFKLKKYTDKYARPINREEGVYSSPYIEGKTFGFSSRDFCGEYVYANPMGVKGRFTLFANVDSEDFHFSLLRHAAADEGGEDAIVGEQHICLPADGNFEHTILYGGYTFSVKFYDHFLIIRKISGSASSCFGNGVGVTGIYAKIPSKG